MESQEHYGILGVGRNASGAEIKSAYRRLAQRFHPDVSDDPDGESKFKAVAEAYRTLKRLETRQAYDRQALPGSGGAEMIWIYPTLDIWGLLFQWPIWACFWVR